jgi:Ser/Thr protein kinase RdoA (MazF antagonist)
MADALARAIELADKVVRASATLEGVAARVVGISENVVLALERDGSPVASLRVPRLGYRTRAELEDEMAWLAALARAGVAAPVPITLEGQRTPGLVDCSEDDVVVVLRWVPGWLVSEGPGSPPWEELGRLAARLHAQVLSWEGARRLRRWRWSASTMAGRRAHWGSYERAGVSRPERVLLRRAAEAASERLDELDLDDILVHSDLRGANVVRTAESLLVPIDFDDAGYGSRLTDLAGSLSFVEHESSVTEAAEAWLQGYCAVMPLDARERHSLWPLVLLRRLALTGWVASRDDSEVASRFGREFVEGTLAVAERFLTGRFPAGVQ